MRFGHSADIFKSSTGENELVFISFHGYEEEIKEKLSHPPNPLGLFSSHYLKMYIKYNIALISYCWKKDK